MYNLVNILLILLAIWAGYMLHGIIKKKLDPRSSGGNLLIYIVFHAAMIFLLVYLASLLIMWSTYWFIKK